MKDIDRKIREALKEEDAELFEKYGGEQPIYEAVTDLFRFRPRILLVGTILFTLVAIVVSIYSGFQFYNAIEMREMILWGGLCILCLTMVTAIKIWAWMEMSKNALTREIKRLELQIVNIAHSIDDLQK